MILWDHRPLVVKLMTAGFVASFSAQVVFMGIALANLGPTVTWSEIANMCIVSSTTPTFIAVWAAPMLFEILVLVLTILNALDRPRGAQLPVVKALYRDGIIYFVALTTLRALNLGFASIRQPSLIMLGAFFVWAMTTTVLNRSLLRLRNAEVKHMEYELSIGGFSGGGRTSPFDLGKSISDIEMPTYDRVSRMFSR
ncbi:hypothetical protein QCA50_011688 [Cerrena zonata]|uniref:Transmembrane protein n=1 Tax=Cerrena zonata TaxID=2478898 RepID=A0AAW0G1V0_9APHY